MTLEEIKKITEAGAKVNTENYWSVCSLIGEEMARPLLIAYLIKESAHLQADHARKRVGETLKEMGVNNPSAQIKRLENQVYVLIVAVMVLITKVFFFKS